MLSQKLINQIDQLRETFSARMAEGALEEKSPILVSAQSDTVRVSAQLIDCDRLGYLLTALEAQLINDNQAGIAIDKVQIEDQIGMLLGKITYLTEALTLVEKEADLSRVLIRSANPEKRVDGIYYYELTLEAGKSIRLNRRCYNFETRRRGAVPFTLSKELFERLVGDFAEMLCPGDEKADTLPARFEIYPSSW
ncbi:hypothetical protein HYR99_31675 [Candidatus Poribacteria bacterium]|nr:hypothetical protein [Candidatus Poribacteria bacterium]